MALQARAEATRRRILDSAIELFDELGYGETGLADVLQRASVSKGAFYYHFDSKEAVAAAIIEQHRKRIDEMLRNELDLSATPLQQLIAASFAAAALINSENASRIGNELAQASSQISTVAAQTYREWTADFTADFKRAVEAAGYTPGVDVDEAADAAWAAILGCHLLSSTIAGDPYARLQRTWRVLLRPIVPTAERDEFDDLLERTAAKFQATV